MTENIENKNKLVNGYIEECVMKKKYKENNERINKSINKQLNT